MIFALNPLVSVVMPVHNGGAYLAAAVESILTQSHANLELILVDDHSTDDAITTLNKSDRRLKIIASECRGVVAASNTGFTHCEGEYIARMDADDISLEGRLECQLDYLAQRREIDIAGCRVEIFSDEGIQGGLQRYQAWLNSVCEPEQVHRQIFIESPLPNPGIMLRRSALRELKGYREMVWAEDYDLLLRADAVGMQMGKPEPILLRWREHDTRLTHTGTRYSHENFMQAKTHFLAHHRLKGRGVIIWGAGPTGQKIHDFLTKEGTTVVGFIDVHPRRIGGEKRGLPVWAMDKCKEPGLPMILVAVGAAGAREDIAGFMSGTELNEGEDYLFVA
jgi:glycosyltransferase involved in cell wall biosynthesis